ncbi:hypothetical protein PE067_08370 [Paracoccus sp. DMF-8]|uniref:hypothetical protein n=1 Tax=Paracoccus sp. DMF-8 TaxID=3019445 RepID=UPI0023E8D526|nr:hypothetical protein [Paracoccus sp. DMF-8]MDF3606141.1 hypothetical protein [Paracoccus sp. DMF-8]
MIYVAQIEDGIVIRVVVSPASIEPPEGWVVIGPENTVGIGWTYVGGVFVPPEPVEGEGA